MFGRILPDEVAPSIFWSMLLDEVATCICWRMLLMRSQNQ